jgi:hypothetical protein
MGWWWLRRFERFEGFDRFDRFDRFRVRVLLRGFVLPAGTGRSVRESFLIGEMSEGFDRFEGFDWFDWFRVRVLPYGFGFFLARACRECGPDNASVNAEPLEANSTRKEEPEP